ncbi:hypothetical protein CSUB01_08547 [Colletotrichum sublineola]|uniref:Uncharacterized protein n=1 Tax=Colletotrichum sublineola TaxID=1173701 RepID=A0A066XBR4_COLSU|nr:hypothetical protein CSUB01_08547 [Colletotrichum sublineola]
MNLNRPPTPLPFVFGSTKYIITLRNAFDVAFEFDPGGRPAILLRLQKKTNTMDLNVLHPLQEPDHQLFWSESIPLSLEALDAYQGHPDVLQGSNDDILLQLLPPQHISGLTHANIPPWTSLDHIARFGPAWCANVTAGSANLSQHVPETANLLETPLYESANVRAPTNSPTNPPPTRPGHKRAHQEITRSDPVQTRLVTPESSALGFRKKRRQEAQRQPRHQQGNAARKVTWPASTTTPLGCATPPRPSASNPVDLIGGRPSAAKVQYQHRAKKRLRSAAPAPDLDPAVGMPETSPSLEDSSRSPHQATSPNPLQGRRHWSGGPPAAVISTAYDNDAHCAKRQHKEKQKEGAKQQVAGRRVPVRLSSYQRHVMELLDIIKRECR